MKGCHFISLICIWMSKILFCTCVLLEQIKFKKHNNIDSSLYLQPIMKSTVQSEVFTVSKLCMYKEHYVVAMGQQ